MTRSFSGAAAVALLLLLFSVLPVAAHAELEESDPADGETIETPYKLTATFSEEFDPNPQRSFVRVVDSSDAEIASGGVSDDNPTVMTVELPALEPGEYTVRWQTTTADDNGVERGTYTFNVAATPTPGPTATPTPVPPPAAPSSPLATATPAATATPLPVATPTPVDPAPSGTGSDAVLALLIGAVAIGAIAIFLFARSRR